MKTLIALTSSDKERIKSLFEKYTKESESALKMAISGVKKGWWDFSKWTYDPAISLRTEIFIFFDFHYCGYLENKLGQFIVSINDIAKSSDIVLLDDEEVKIFNKLIIGNNND